VVLEPAFSRPLEVEESETKLGAPAFREADQFRVVPPVLLIVMV
jgi:hypothetical protein